MTEAREYNHDTDRRITASELEIAVKPLRERIIAMEVLLEQRAMRIRHLEETLAEMRSGLKIGSKYSGNEQKNKKGS